LVNSQKLKGGKMEMEKVKKEMTWVCHKMWEKGWVASNDGNISVKIDNDRFLITPAGISKLFINPSMILEINSSGKILKGNKKYKPSSEFPMHIRCYQDRDDVKAVVHAHPPYSTGFAAAQTPIKPSLIEAILSFGEVPVAKYALPGSEDVPKSIAPYLSNYDAILLAHHGALTLGNNLLDAFFRMESLELCAKTVVVAHIIGGQKKLTQKQIKDCIDLRKKRRSSKS
jgi:L-fuculose-phosphate aldolase